MPTFLGLLVAAAVSWCGVRWYLAETQRAVPSLRRSAPSPTRSRRLQPLEVPPLVPLEAAERLLARREAAPAAPPATPPNEAPAVATPAPVLATGEDREAAEIPMVAELAEPAAEKVPPQTPVVAASIAPPIPIDISRPTFAEPSAPAEATPAEGEIVGYCPRCHTERLVADATHTTTRKGKPAIRGHCAVCGAGIFVFGDE